VNTYSFGAQGKAEKAIISYDYIRRRKSSEKVGCSIGSAWVGSEAAFN